MDTFTIIRNKERYGSSGSDKLPDSFTVTGLSQIQADTLAQMISNHYPGCDYAFYVEGGDGDES